MLYQPRKQLGFLWVMLASRPFASVKSFVKFTCNREVRKRPLYFCSILRRNPCLEWSWLSCAMCLICFTSLPTWRSQGKQIKWLLNIKELFPVPSLNIPLCASIHQASVAEPLFCSCNLGFLFRITLRVRKLLLLIPTDPAIQEALDQLDSLGRKVWI